jgi:hypothetical protein
MLTRFLTYATFIAVCVASGSNAAIAASADADRAGDTNKRPEQSATFVLTSLKNAQASGTEPSTRGETFRFSPVQYQFQQVALYCYTYAGPVCPMVIAVPPGTPCTCSYPYGALAGIAR